MLAAIRNTFLTALALVASVIGVGWNRQTVQQDQPALVSQRVRSALTSGVRNQLPLTLTLTASTLRLGDWQEITVLTAPSAEVELAIVYPDGRSDRPPTARAQASPTGQFTTRFQLNDWRQLGVFQVIVIASAGARQAKAKASFVLDPLVSHAGRDRGERYTYPIVP